MAIQAALVADVVVVIETFRPGSQVTTETVEQVTK